MNKKIKIAVSAARVIVGSLFIFSGLVKAIDPTGLAYKMEEFFEAWANSGFLPKLMHVLNTYSLSFSIVMIALEVILGVALLVGFKKNITTWLLLLLISFFTFLTSYVLLSGKIRACGCFGDCIPLTPIQTFTKDIVLLLLILFIFFNKKYIQPISKFSFISVLLSLLFIGGLQWYVLKHLPLKDCLPFKPGNDILALRKMPANAVPDKFDYLWTYQKGGEKKTFTTATLPDSTWQFVDRKQTLIKKGANNIPLINDFSLTAASGTDTTELILSQPKNYYLFFLKELENNYNNWLPQFDKLWQYAQQQQQQIYIVTSQPKAVDELFNQKNKYNITLLTCDATAIKTAARANPTLFLMNGPIVKSKYSWADILKVIP
jgi:uncharacterized membrane protein YphA (DoxX/SURF4 family)